MRPKNFKGGRCIKTKLKKCEEVARTYDKIQTAYYSLLEEHRKLLTFIKETGLLEEYNNPDK